jgi:hypothetical protein
MRWMLAIVAATCTAACSSSQPDEIDPCIAFEPLVEEGAIELGLGNTFTPVTAGETVTLTLGAQGLWMFIGNARVRGMDVGPGDLRAAIDYDVLAADGSSLALDVGCRGREFATGGSDLEMVTPYFVPLDPQFPIDGVAVTIVVEIRDHQGRFANDRRDVIARTSL